MKRFIPYLVLVLGALWVVSTLAPRKSASQFNLDGFGRLPVLANGRIKPLDTVARSALLQLQGRQRVTVAGGNTIQPIEWLATLGFDSAKADALQTFEIIHPEVLALFKLQPQDGDKNKRFSFNQLKPGIAELMRQSQLAQQLESAQRSAFQRAVVQLHFNLNLYHEIKHTFVMPDSADFLSELLRFQNSLPKGVAAVRARQQGQAYSTEDFDALIALGQRYDAMATSSNLRLIPPSESDHDPAEKDHADHAHHDWRTTGQALLETFETGGINPSALAYAGLAHAWHANQSVQFNRIIELYDQQLRGTFGPALKKVEIEARFNAAQPFYTSMILYVLAFILAIASWLKWSDPLGRSAFWLTVLAFIVTTAGIAARMWLEGRPPVTNLYSSALFIGWGSALLCIILESFYKNAVGSVAAGLIGFGTLLIAHHLSLGGDTLEMMRAVLDSNFWLATHVIVITIGYSATFLAGFLALIYIIRGLFTTSLDQATADALARMVYGIVCFATLFSLIGTVLGGIWADQSWGRFWGWDPKENGALIIVLWNAIILHARWGGLVRQRGLMCFAVFGNIVTGWSWFGTNLLGVGLHSYGFTEQGFWWLFAFAVSHIAIILAAQIPVARWRSSLR